MKKQTLLLLWVLLLTAMATVLWVVIANASELKKVNMTCYTHTGNKTASGVMPYVGGCAFQSKYIGCKVVVYENNDGAPGNMIGIFDINDTGYGAPTKNINEKTGEPYGTIQMGWSIDIFQDSLEDCRAFIKAHGDKCYIRIIKERTE